MQIAIRGYKTIIDLNSIINQTELEIAYIIDINAILWGGDRWHTGHFANESIGFYLGKQIRESSY